MQNDVQKQLIDVVIVSFQKGCDLCLRLLLARHRSETPGSSVIDRHIVE